MNDSRSAADRIESAQIRAWARDNGWPDIKDRGKISAAIREAWEAASGQPAQLGYDQTEDGGDISSMDEADLDLPGWVPAGNSDGVTLTPAGPVVLPAAGPDVEPPGDDEGLPAPASLDEARERAGRDPEAAHLRNRNRAAAKRDKPEPVKITKAVRDDITGKLAFWLAIPAEPWLRVDPYCGQAYADQVDQIALKMSPLICLSPDMVRWFSKSTTFILWTELGMACRPVIEAVIAHHVTKRIALDQEGQAVEQPTGGVDFSAYSARVSSAALLRVDC